MSVTVRLRNGQVITVDKTTADRLVRKQRAVYYATATKTHETAVRRAAAQR